MSGWIKLHRSITEHWLYTEKRKFSKFEAWNDILLTVNYSPAKTIIKGKIININRGESILSLDSWGNKWGWNKSSVKRFFELLKKEGMIELKSETITTRLSVCKYDTYQQKENESETQTKRRRNADETQVKPIEEEEERKEEKNKQIIPSIDEFLAYAISLKQNVNTDNVKLKYNSWLVNDWKINRNGKEVLIKNWKTTLSNTIQYLGETDLKFKPSTLDDYASNVMKQVEALKNLNK
jgi:DNA-binding transcriptional regulator YhcF (GntR family)